MSHTATCGLDPHHSHAHLEPEEHDHDQTHADGEHGHSHGLVDRSIMRSRAGLRAVGVTLVLLGITALIQAAIYLATGSVALLADLIHNGGDALTAVPLGAAFLLRSEQAERGAGLAVVLTILVSALVAGSFAIERIVHPLPPTHLFALGAAGFVGVIGNAIAARIRLGAGRRLDSAALIADGQHARSDAIVSAGVVATAIVVALGLPIIDPIMGLVITGLILHITWESWQTVRGERHRRTDAEWAAHVALSLLPRHYLPRPAGARRSKEPVGGPGAPRHAPSRASMRLRVLRAPPIVTAESDGQKPSTTTF